MALTPEQHNKILQLGIAGKLSGKLPKRLQPIPDPEKTPMAEPQSPMPHSSDEKRE